MSANTTISQALLKVYDPDSEALKTVTGASAAPKDLLLDDTTTADALYVGQAAIGSGTDEAVWQIKFIDLSSGVAITWAGTGAYDQVWDDRESLTYT